MSFDGLASAKPHNFDQSFCAQKKRPVLITLYMGIDFFPTTGALNRINSDIICFPSHSDRQHFRDIIPYDVHSSKGLLVYSPKFFLPPSGLRKHERIIQNVYFLMQAIVPASRSSRLHFLKLINRTAKRHPSKRIIVKLRHLAGENSAHMHPEEFPFQSLAEDLQLEKNLSFSAEPMSEVIEKADFCVTCSSTAGIETLLNGIPTLFWVDYPQAEADPLTAKSRQLFQDCGLLATEDDIIALTRKEPRKTWLCNFMPEDNPIGKLISYIRSDAYKMETTSLERV